MKLKHLTKFIESCKQNLLGLYSKTHSKLLNKSYYRHPYYLLIFPLFYFSMLTKLSAQVTNGNVNYQINVLQGYWIGDDDGDVGIILYDEEPTIKVGACPDGNGISNPVHENYNGWHYNAPTTDCGSQFACINWKARCNSGCWSHIDDTKILSASNQSDPRFDITFYSWENDNNPVCEENSDDDRNWWYSLWNAKSVGSRNYWRYDNFSPGGNGAIYRYKAIYRYSNGTRNSPLNFGTLTTNVFHVNSNRLKPTDADNGLGYLNEWSYTPSPDVTYSFEIAGQARNVTISTNSGGTNFDTYLSLIDENGARIAFNDDVGGGTKSEITIELCAGVYRVVVEGYSTYVGEFQLNISSSALSFNPGTINTSLQSACENTPITNVLSYNNGTSIAGMTPNYQWERKIGGGSWIEISGETNNHLINPGNMGTDDISYRRKASVCGFEGYSNIETVAYATLLPTVPVAFQVISNNAEQRVELSWEIVNGASYNVIRTEPNGSSIEFERSLDDIEYQSGLRLYFYDTVDPCKTYTYEVESINGCGVSDTKTPELTARIEPAITQAFSGGGSLTASKGYFSDRIELSWSTSENSGNSIDKYIIERKLTGDPVSNYIERGDTESNTWSDINADPGVFYDYRITGTTICEGETILSDSISDIGFRSKFAQVSGNVSYLGPINIEGAKIIAEPTGANLPSYSIDLNGGWTTIPTPNIEIDTAIIIEGWINFKTYAWLGYWDTQNIYVIEDWMSSTLGNEYIDINDPNAINANTWMHVASQMTTDSLFLYINGDVVSRQARASNASLTAPNKPFYPAWSDGLVTEFRYWNLNKSHQQIKEDYARFMTGFEEGLQIYHPMNEGAGEYTYDRSRQSETEFNRNHASGPFTWSNNVPTQSQLGHGAVTDKDGNYIVNLPYGSSGSNYKLVPDYRAHTFDPTNRILFVGDGASVINGIDFTDISSFLVTGSLFYEGTACPVEGAFIKIDGQIQSSFGEPVQTQADGSFEVQVPIGEHVLSITTQGSEIPDIRWPADRPHDFQEERNLEPFFDPTTVRVSGRVVGGDREGSKKLGFGESVSNIGTATISFTAQNCDFTRDISTDSVSGEYFIDLPPLRVQPTVNIIDDPQGINNYFALDPKPFTDLSQELLLTTVYDTTFLADGVTPERIDSFSYNTRIDFIYRTEPQIMVYGPDGINPFIGDTTLVVESIDGQGVLTKSEINLRQNPLQWPVFTERNDEFLYRCLVRVFEFYENPRTGKTDTVPTVNGELRIDNKLSHLSEFEGIDTVDIQAVHTIEMSKINTPETVKNLVYSFKTGSPNMNTETFEAHNYTRPFTITLNRPGKDPIEWTPVTDPNLISPGSKGYYRAYILGSVTNSATYFTEGIEVPDFILRDPPGSSSSASLTIGGTKVSQSSYSWSLGTAASTSDKVNIGADFAAGLGVSLNTELKNNIQNKFQASISGGRGGSQQISTTWSEKTSTSSLAKRVGAASDVYFGSSKNIEFALSEELAIVDESLCNEVACQPTGPLPGKRFAKIDGIAFVPGGFDTYFTYSQHQIITEIIPRAYEARNALLQDGSLYDVKYGINSEYYGVNNDALDLPGRNSNDHQQPEVEDLLGASYDYIPFRDGIETDVDALRNDRVRFFNNQIKMWENTIKQNEEEKARVDDPIYIDSLKMEELDAIDSLYADVNREYIGLSAGLGAAAIPIAFGLISTPVPGTSIAGYVTFGVTTGLGIAQNELVGQYEEYQTKRQRIEEKFLRVEAGVRNRSFDAGVGPITESLSVSTASSRTENLEYTLGAQFQLEIGGKVNGNGLNFTKAVGVNFKSGNNWRDSESETEKVEFTLSDNNLGDDFTIDIFESPLGWGPIFKTRNGETSCPYEPATMSQYYTVDGEPVELSKTTAQRDKPVMTLTGPDLLQNIPSDGVATFELAILNDSQVDGNRTFIIETLATSNPYGANVNIDFFPSAEVRISNSETLTKILTVEKGPGSVYEYNDIHVIIFAECDKLVFRDTVTVSAHFIPTCTDVSIFTPLDQWVVNTTFPDSGRVMPIVIGDYDYNETLLQNLTLKYKSIDEPIFTPVQEFWKNTALADNPNALEIPSAALVTNFDWTHGLLDGHYDLQVESVCADSDGNVLATNVSDIHRGYIDTKKPEAFGSPSPADGILDPNDDIFIRLNEVINEGFVTDLNFDLRGVINGTTLNGHMNSLSLDGIDDFASIPEYQLQKRSFSVEFWIQKTRPGVEVILSQGNSASDELLISTTADDKLSFKVGTSSVTSDRALVLNQWYHCVFSYDQDNRIAEIFMANVNDDGPSRTANGPIITDYSSTGPLLIGMHSTGGMTPFNGFIHELRLWGNPLTDVQIAPRRNETLSGRELGLIGYWPLDEAYGIIGFDKVRSRHANVSNASWNILPQNHAFGFNGIDEYLVSDSVSTLAYDNEGDLTLEAWFKTNAAQAGTLFSNGKSDISDPSNSAWSLALNTSGQVYIQNNGVSVTTPLSYNDDDWHHISVVVDRASAVSMYIDGDLVKTSNASAFNDFGGNKLWVGTLGWIEPNGSEMRTQYFEGSLDDIRIWNTARKPEQVKRDFTHQMEGDELGLQVYYPFDIVERDEQNQIVRNESLIDVSPNGYDLSLGGMTSELYLTTAPPVKIPRFIQRVDFDYSINGDEIYIEITDSPAKVENVTIDITVEGLKDLAGNKMESPETWIAFVNKNQVFWDEEYFYFEKKLEDNLSFSATLKNTGGSQENYTISNLPSWLTASSSSGSINPNSSIDITFSVEPLLNIGEYEQDIFVTTESFGFNERFLLDLKVYEDPPEWTVDPAAYNYSMSIVGEAFINDIISIDDEDVISVWTNEELRGTANVEYDPQSGKHLVFLSVFSNEEFYNTELLNFKLWDASNGRILEAETYLNDVLQTIYFAENELIGTRGNPLAIKAEALIELEYDINSGWNWLSFPLESETLETIDGMLEDLPLVEGDFIRDLNDVAFFDYQNNNNWSHGTLEEFNTNEGYKMKVAQEGTFSYTGTFEDPDQDPIHLKENWNWIGVKSLFIIDVPSALASLDLETGDLIKGQSSFAVYEEGFGWGGNLDFLVPMEGYMFKYHKKTDLHFPGFGNINGRANSQDLVDQNTAKRQLDQQRVIENYQAQRASFVEGTYPTNMSLIAELDECLNVTNPEDWILAAFATGECRGVTSKSPDNRYYLSIEGDSQVALEFRLVHINDNTEIVLNETFDFVADGLVGSLSSPYLFTCGDIVESDCPENRMINNDEMSIGQSVFKANSNIQSDAQINAGNGIIYQAGVEVNLLNNFEVAHGTTFEVIIEACDNE